MTVTSGGCTRCQCGFSGPTSAAPGSERTLEGASRLFGPHDKSSLCLSVSVPVPVPLPHSGLPPQNRGFDPESPGCLSSTVDSERRRMLDRGCLPRLSSPVLPCSLLLGRGGWAGVDESRFNHLRSDPSSVQRSTPTCRTTAKRFLCARVCVAQPPRRRHSHPAGVQRQRHERSAQGCSK